MSPFHVRPVGRLDRNRWHSLWIDYLTSQNADVLDAVTEQTWSSFFEATGHSCLVAVDTVVDEIVGFSTYLHHPSTWTLHGYCYLEDLFVDSQHRSRGVGRSLIDAVTQVAIESGITRVYWVTEQKNSTARRLYDELASQATIVQYRIATEP